MSACTILRWIMLHPPPPALLCCLLVLSPGQFCTAHLIPLIGSAWALLGCIRIALWWAPSVTARRQSGRAEEGGSVRAWYSAEEGPLHLPGEVLGGASTLGCSCYCFYTGYYAGICGYCVFGYQQEVGFCAIKCQFLDNWRYVESTRITFFVSKELPCWLP